MTYKLFFTTDIHGSDRCFRKFINSAKFYGAHILVLGGDMTGKAVVPVVHAAGNAYTADLGGRPRQVEAADLDALIKEIKFNGLYPYLTTPDELQQIHQDPQGKEKLFRQCIQKSLEEWFSLAEDRLKPLDVKVYISPGNDDDFVVDQVLESNDFIIDPEDKDIEISPGVWMLSLGYSNPTPWNSPRELPEDRLKQQLQALAEKMPDDGISLYNVHVPPIDTPIDQAAKLDSTLKPVVQGGQVVMTGVGSTAVREVIQEYQPTMGLHGHVHESPGVVRIGKTVCLNPGSEYSDGILRGALLSIDEKKKKVSYQLTMG